MVTRTENKHPAEKKKKTNKKLFWAARRAPRRDPDQQQGCGGARRTVLGGQPAILTPRATIAPPAGRQPRQTPVFARETTSAGHGRAGRPPQRGPGALQAGQPPASACRAPACSARRLVLRDRRHSAPKTVFGCWAPLRAQAAAARTRVAGGHPCGLI